MGCVCLPLRHHRAALPVTRAATGSLRRGCPGFRLPALGQAPPQAWMSASPPHTVWELSPWSRVHMRGPVKRAKLLGADHRGSKSAAVLQESGGSHP